MNLPLRIELAGNILATLALAVASVRIHNLADLPRPTPANCVLIATLLLLGAVFLRSPFSRVTLVVAAASWLFANAQLVLGFPHEELWPPQATIHPIPFLVFAICTVASAGRPFDQVLAVRPCTAIACAAAAAFLHPWGEDITAYTDQHIPEFAFLIAPAFLVVAFPATRIARPLQVAFVIIELVIAVALAWLVALPYLKTPRLSLLQEYYWPWFAVPAALGVAPSLFQSLHRRSGNA